MGVVKAHEPMCVQAFCPKFTVERFDEGVVGRLSWPREVENDTIGVSPQIKIAGDERESVSYNYVF